MNIKLCERTRDTVVSSYEKYRQPEITRTLPMRDLSLEETLAQFERTSLPDSASCGKTLWANGHYVGDLWIYSINTNETPNAMLSFCIFETEFWGKGIMSQAVALFLPECVTRYSLSSIGAFVYADNLPSVKVLQKNGFVIREELVEDGRVSVYLEKSI